MNIEVVSGKQWPDAVASLLHGLPEWFGIQKSVQDYITAARYLPGTAAIRNDDVVGVCLAHRHTRVAAEIKLLAVDRMSHRQGIGRRLVQAVEVDLRESGIKLLQVKTLGPSASSNEYQRTRAFYESVGFMPVEERTDIWGPDNPCLISVKPLR